MRIGPSRSLECLAVASTLLLASCDSLSAGRLADDPSAPQLLRIVIQDEALVRRMSRAIATDLLDQAAPICCSDDNPCPAGQLACVLPGDPALASLGSTCATVDANHAMQGTCPDPLNPKNTPPAIGIRLPSPPFVGGGNQIRLVWSRILDLSIESTSTDPVTNVTTYTFAPGVVELDGRGGKAIPSLIYYDPSGVPGATLPPTPMTPENLFAAPYGPAIVIKPMEALSAGETYTIKLDPTQIKDRSGAVATKDVNGPIQTAYTFTTEGLYPINLSLRADRRSGMPLPLAPTDAVGISTNADFATTSLGPETVKVVDKAGNPVAVRAFPDLGPDRTACVANPRLLDVVAASGAWAEGSYTLTVSGLRSDTGKVTLKADVTGAADFTVPFTVKQGAMPSNPALPPELCAPLSDGGASGAPDGGSPTDGAQGG